MPRNRGGRPTKLTPQVQKRLCALLVGGNYRDHACECCNISYDAFIQWIKRGRREGKGLYFQFLVAVKRAEAQSFKNALQTIRKAAKGGQVVERRTVTRSDGSVEVTEKLQPGQWTAAAWYAERKGPERFGTQNKEMQMLRREIEELRKLVGGRVGGAATNGEAARGQRTT
jgi:hypothetical protein